MPRFETTTCYHCDAEGTGREHVPPKCLYPKGNEWVSLMTVPSCAAHNNAASKSDEYLKFLLGATASNVPNAIVRDAARGAIRLTLRGSRQIHRHGFRWNGDILSIDNDFPLDFELLSACLSKMARAIYFHHYNGGKKLLGEIHVCPLFIPINPEKAPELASVVASAREMTARHFEERPKLGPHKEIFAYQVVELTEHVVVNMEFYGAHRVAVVAVRAQ